MDPFGLLAGAGELAGTTVTCPCHGSQFDVTSGAVLEGPAKQPVCSRAVRIEGADVLIEAIEHDGRPPGGG